MWWRYSVAHASIVKNDLEMAMRCIGKGKTENHRVLLLPVTVVARMFVNTLTRLNDTNGTVGADWSTSQTFVRSVYTSDGKSSDNSGSDNFGTDSGR